MKSYIEIDGAPIDALDVTWVHYAPCGCVCGLSLAQLAPLSPKDPGMKPRLTEDDVEEDTPKIVRERERKQGFQWKPMRRSDTNAVAMLQPCLHVPTWGVQPDLRMEGMVWATTDSHRNFGLRTTRRRHLVPTDRGEAEWIRDDAERKAAHEALWARKGGTVTACGKTSASYNAWITDRLTETIPCSACMKTATHQLR